MSFSLGLLVITMSYKIWICISWAVKHAIPDEGLMCKWTDLKLGAAMV